MTGTRCRVHAFAKINLSLRVVGRRPDGFHDLETVFQSIALHDTLVFTPRPGPFAVTCSDPAVPTDESNLAWKAAAALWEKLGRAGEPRGVEIAITKRIPLRAGLGGGSADAAAALVGLSCLWPSRKGRAPDLPLTSSGIGADVAYFHVGGTALALGRGDNLYPLEDIARLHIVLAIPPFGVSTAEAYRWFDEHTSSAREAFRGGGDRVRAWPARDLAIGNDLEDPVAGRHPEIAVLVRRLRRRGALAARMTGSGSAVFGLFDDAARSAGAAVALVRNGFRAVLTETIGRGEYLRRRKPVVRR